MATADTVECCIHGEHWACIFRTFITADCSRRRTHTVGQKNHAPPVSFFHHVNKTERRKWYSYFELTHTHTFNGSFSRTTRVSRYQKGKTNLDFTEARDSEWQWHQLGMCKSAPRSRQITMPAPHCSDFLQAGCPSCSPTNSVKALKAQLTVFTN